MTKNQPPSKRQPFGQSLRHKLFDWLDRMLGQPTVQYLVFVTFIFAIVGVMTAGFQLTQPTLSQSNIGKIARRDIKATRDFTYKATDEEATKKQRRQMELQVPPVYDWNEATQQLKRDQISKAFSSMRQAMAKRVKPKPAPVPKGVEGPTPNPTPSDSQLIAQLGGEEKKRLAGELRTTHFDQYVDVSLSKETFETLAERGFDATTEIKLLNLVDAVMSKLIVDTAEPISRHPTQGMYLRRLNKETLLIEYQLRQATERIITPDTKLEAIARAGQVLLGDVQTAQQRQFLIMLASTFASSNTIYNAALTQEKRAQAQDAVRDVERVQSYQKGQILVDKGQRITKQHVDIYLTMQASSNVLERAQILAGLVILALLVMIVLWLFGRHNMPGFELTRKDVAFLGTTLLLFLIIARLGKALSFAFAEQIPIEAMQLSIPFAAAAMLVRLMLRTPVAVIFSIVYAMLVSVIMDQMLLFSTFTILGSLVGIGYVKQVKRRMSIMGAGVAVGGVNLVLVTAYFLTQGSFGVETIYAMLFALFSGIASGSLVLALLPVFEAGFQYTTDIKLLELSNMNHPLLRELILRAPGSYHHSMMVGSLTEAAAEAIQCNSLLARVGAYYHDIGKAKNPGYFAENQKFGVNPHDKLKPNMSALIIKAHVKDGIEMAKQHGMPKEIIDFIAQHHGTSLIAYFYHKAKKMEDPDIPEVVEKDYRYPGPKPQTRETAICLLADGIEAASRAMPNPTPARLKGLVQNMINKAFTDGQLDECDLTLKDLNIIAQAFMRILTGIYHHRPEYPEQKKQNKPVQDIKKKVSKRPGQSSGERPAITTETVNTDDVANTKEQEQNEHGRADSGQSPAVSQGQSTQTAVEDEGRISLPRLGSP